MEGVRVFVIFLCVVLGSKAHGPGHTHSHHHHSPASTNIRSRSHVSKATTSQPIQPGPSFSFPQFPPQSFHNGICMSLVRRTVMGQQVVTYPCFRPIPGVVPQVARQRHMPVRGGYPTIEGTSMNSTEGKSPDTAITGSLSPIGLICQGLVRIPRAEFIRVPTCCPGWRRSPSGACVKRDEGKLIIQTSLQPKLASQKSRPPMMPQLPLPMMHKMPLQISSRLAPQISPRLPPQISPRFSPHTSPRLPPQMSPRMPPHISSRLPPQLTASQISERMSPLQRPSMMRRPNAPGQKLIPKSLNDLTPYPASNGMEKRMRLISTFRNSPLARFGNSMAQWAPRAMYMREMQMGLRAAQMAAQRRAQIMRNIKRQMMMRRRRPFNPPGMFRRIMIPKGLRLLHIIRTLKPKMKESVKKDNIIAEKQKSSPVVPAKPFPQIPQQKQDLRTPQSQGIMGRLPSPVFLSRLLPHVMSMPNQDGPTPIPDISASELRPKPNLDLVRFPQLPKFPIEMPPVRVQPGPNSLLNPHAQPQICFAEYVKIVKQCLKDANVELPATQNFLPGKSSYDQGGVCEKRQMITECIVSNLRPCVSFTEQNLVRRTLADTLAEMNRDCHLHELESIESRLVGDVQPGPDAVHNKLEPIVPVPNATPSDDVTPAPTPAEITTEAPKVHVEGHDHNDDTAVASVSDTVRSKQEDTIPHHTHDILIEEASHDYYLPLLIGTAIGLAAITILLCTLVCICCRRRIKRKIYIDREPEKPGLLNGVYTIGVPPPVYEVNGIPPISYEEAKGEKITGSPSSLRRHNIENEAYESVENTTRNGVVSDI